MTVHLEEICLASIPLAHLHLLAEIRCVPEVFAAVVDDRVWLRWPAGTTDVVRCLLPVPGVKCFGDRDGNWFQWNHSLPAFDIPRGVKYVPLFQLLVPAPVETTVSAAVDLSPVGLSLVADHSPRQTTACLCRAGELQAWADSVSSVQLNSVQAAVCGDRVLLLGKCLPLFRRGQRFWGQRILLPLGYRLEPELPESAVAEAVGLEPSQLLLMQESGAETIPQEVLQPLSRVAIRLLSTRNAHEPRQ